jgi:hypothetical protein
LSPRHVALVDGDVEADDGDSTAHLNPQGHRSPTFSQSRGRTVAEIGQQEDSMEQIIECPCGTVLQGPDLEAVIDQAKSHAHEVHDMDLSDEQATSMARPA